MINNVVLLAAGSENLPVLRVKRLKSQESRISRLMKIQVRVKSLNRIAASCCLCYHLLLLASTTIPVPVLVPVVAGGSWQFSDVASAKFLTESKFNIFVFDAAEL
jgi:hypothetical protein